MVETRAASGTNGLPRIAGTVLRRGSCMCEDNHEACEIPPLTRAMWTTTRGGIGDDIPVLEEKRRRLRTGSIHRTPPLETTPESCGGHETQARFCPEKGRREHLPWRRK
jgi:hypothetical protein